MKLADLFIKLGLKKEGFDRGIDSAKKKTNSLGSALKKVGGLVAGAFAVGAVVNFTKQVLNAYNIQAQAENQLLVALKGRKDVQQDLIKQAGELQGKTLFGDEETIQAQALIAAFVKEGDQIKKVIPLVQDLATAKGMQLAGAADLVSKTLGSSTNALSRYGIEVEGAVGSSARLESLMVGLNNAFGGQAEAAAKVGTGALIQLENKWGDIKEQIGGSVANSEEFAKAIDSLGKGLIVIANNLDGFIKFLNGLSRAGEIVSGGWLTKWVAGLWKSDKATKENTKSQEEQNEVVEEFKNLLEEVTISADENNKIWKKKRELWDKQNEAYELSIDRLSDVESAISNVGKTLNEATKDVDKWFDAWTEGADVSGIVGGGGVFGMVGDEVGEDVGFDTEAYVAALAQEKAFINDMNSMLEAGMADFTTTFAAGIGEALATGEWDDFGSAILEMIGGFMQQLGALMIAYAINMALFSAAATNPLSWPIALAAGVAMVAAGAAISSFASGGIGGAGASSASGYSPSASTAGTAISVNVNFVLEGDKLVGAINNNNSRKRLTR